MAILTQYYTPNQEFEISSVNQLRVDADWKWDGRTLTAFVDQDGKQYDVEDYNQHLSATFSGMEASLSGRWELNKLPIWLSVIANVSDPEGTGGVLSCVWRKDSDYKPLPEPVSGDFIVSNGETKIERYYKSTLSLCLKASEEYIPVRFAYYKSTYTYWIDVTNPTDILKLVIPSDTASPLSVVAEFQRGILRYYSDKNA